MTAAVENLEGDYCVDKVSVGSVATEVVAQRN